MLHLNQIFKIQYARKKIKPEDVLDFFTYFHSLLFDMTYHTVNKGWHYIGNVNSTVYGNPLNLKEPETDCIEFFKQYKNIESQGKYDFCNAKDKSEYATFIYSNSKESLELTGKKFEKFRAARRYLDIEGVTIEYYGQDNSLPDNVFNELKCFINLWGKDKSTKEGVNYDPTEILGNIGYYGHMVEYFITVIRYKGEIVHYEASERLHENYIVLLDIKHNPKLEQNVASMFKYAGRLAHWLHLTHWDKEYRGNRDNPIYYNVGYGTWEDFKHELVPTFVLSDLIIPIKSKEDENSSNILF